jgi:hypothetical protein
MSEHAHQKLRFPSNMEGNIARVRWHAFQRDVTLLAEELLLLSTAQRELLLHLPK